MKGLLVSVGFLLTLSVFSWAQQPYGGCWHPDYVKNWTPEKDPDAKFNRASIPLKARTTHALKANSNQHLEGRVAVCLTMSPMASLAPSQGANNILGYNPTYWQYMDMLIWWGGSAGEGVILTPTAPVTDACHQNGVKVLGNVFFPPVEFGGQQDWVTQFLTKVNGNYPFARKLYEIAKYYRFDGWFINQETVRPTTNFDKWVEFFAEFSALAQADPSTKHFEIQWYDASSTIVERKEILQPIGSSIFLQYGAIFEENMNSQLNYLASVINPETGVGYTEKESFMKYYYGIEQAQSGLTGNGVIFDRLFPIGGHKGSVNIFNPEENTWKTPLVNAGLFNVNEQGEKAYEATKTIETNEARFWSGTTNSAGWSDVAESKQRNDYWPGLSQAIEERSTITQKPFVSAFSTGKGKFRFVNGAKKGSQDWYHRGMQNILPTWRWWVEATNGGEKTDLTFSVDYDDAYNIGTSIKMGGKLVQGADYLVRLFKTQVSITSGDYVQLAFKGVDPSVIKVKVSTIEDGDANFTTLPLTSTTMVNGWSVANVDISSLNGKTLSVVALNLNSSVAINALSLSLGQLMISPAAAEAIPAVTNLMCDKASAAFTDTSAQLRIVWDAPASEEVSHYNIYLERNGVKTLVGQTRNEGFFIPKFIRSSAAERDVNVYVCTVNRQYQEGAEQKLALQFPEVTAPVVSIKLGNTLASINQEIWYVAKANNYPTGYSWILPSNCELIEQKSDSVKVRFTAAGIYTVAVDVTNSIGTTRATATNCIEVNDSKLTQLANVSAKKVIDSFSGSLPPEDPAWIIDGVDVPSSVRNKWCVGGSKEHWVIIDLKTLYNVYKFVIFDCGNKEDASGNIKNYRILVSQDKENWTEVINEKGRTENTKEDWCAPTPARYVKLVPYDDENPITIRIWEFQVHGIPAPMNFIDEGQKNVPSNTTTNIGVRYTMTEAWSQDATYSVTTTDSEVEISNLAWDKEAGMITFDFNPKTKTGLVKLNLTLKSTPWTCMYEQVIRIEDPEYVVISTGKSIFGKSTTSATTWSSWVDMTQRLNDGIVGSTSSTQYYSMTAYVADVFAILRVDLGDDEVFEVGKVRLDYSTSALATATASNINRFDFYGSNELVEDMSEATYMGSIDGQNFINNFGSNIPTVERRVTTEDNLNPMEIKHVYTVVSMKVVSKMFRPSEITLIGKKKAASSVVTPNKGEASVYAKEGRVIISSENPAVVEVYNVLGAKLLTKQLDSTLEISTLQRNQIYIVKVEDQVFKVKL